MRQFYLGKNQNGYYRVYFVDPVTGVRGPGKSTHTKDKQEATMLACKWLAEGVPSALAHSRAFDSANTQTYSGDLHSFVMHLSDSDAQQVLELLSEKLKVSIPKPVEVETPAIEEPAPTPEAALETKKRYVVIKKKPIVEAKAETVPESPAETDNHLKVYETLFNFWDYDNSDFIKRRIAHGHSMSRKHTIQMQGFAKNNWLPYFGEDKRIEDLTRLELENFFFFLHSQKGFSGETVNKNINCANRCFSWLFTNGKISCNPLQGVERFKVDALERGIPTESEVQKLLQLQWENPMAKLAFKLGAFCGLRAGEISGLRVCDIDLDADMIHVRHSWSEVDKLKCTKNTDTRDLPIDHMTCLQLMNQARMNPNYNELSYVFYAPHNPSEPFYPGYYGDVFYQALEQIGVSEAERKDRNIVFHSLRHFCATILAQRTDIKTVQAVLGHRTEKMSEHYADHDNQEKFDNMRNIMSAAWEKYMSA